MWSEAWENHVEAEKSMIQKKNYFDLEFVFAIKMRLKYRVSIFSLILATVNSSKHQHNVKYPITSVWPTDHVKFSFIETGRTNVKRTHMNERTNKWMSEIEGEALSTGTSIMNRLELSCAGNVLNNLNVL